VDPSRESRSTASTVDSIQSNAIKASKGSEPNSHSSSDATLDAGIDEPMIDAPRSPPTKLSETLGAESLEQERIRTEVESRPGSPGVDPRKAIPISAVDAAQLSEPLINGAQDEHHKAAVVHLPPQDVQEDRLRKIDERRAERLLEKENGNVGGGLAISLPPSQTARTSGEPVSSPGSTIEANSATTPALHEASTDTSPENEGPRYDADRSEGKNLQPETPPELAPSKEEVLEKEEHDRLLKARIEVARAEILASSPAAADAQLRLEEEQAAAASSKDQDREVPDSEKSVSGSSQDVSVADSEEDRSDRKGLTKSAGEVVQDIVEDEEDEVVGVPTPDEGRVPEPETATKHASVVDQAVDGDHMDVDLPVVEKGSKVANLESTAAQPPAADMNLEISSPTAKHPVSRKDFSSNNASISTPRRTPVPAPTPPTLERMTTRVSSGAMRHKSVSEILGEIPRPNTAPISERPAVSKATVDTDSATDSNPQSRASTPQSSASRIRTMVERAKEKERSKLSTVVFAKQPLDRPSNKSAVAASGSRAKDQESAAYFMPLIVHQAYQNTRGVQPLDQLLMSAHKTITTSNAHVTFRDHQTTKVLRRIHSLQLEGKWSFRQPKRSPEPNRPTAHWDELLKEAKWMRTDFREEKKWKMAVARALASACAEWVDADENDRKLLQVNAFIPPAESTHRISNSEPERDSVAPVVERSHSTPELEASRENDSPTDEFDEEPRASMLDAVAPGVMFTSHFDDLVFPLSNSLATNKLLENLPVWGPQFKLPQSDLPTSEVDPDASWRRPALPLSKFATGQIILKDEGPPRKKSRYEYEYEDEEDDQALKRAILEPALRDVALFNPENKHIRDRIHSSHQFRPPSENPMPLQSFFECRMSSQWTWAEDDELKQLVREYSYNWQLISNMLSSRSLFSSSAERRTPWECFERWIHLEGLPADMQKTHYFRAYNNRLEAAQRNVMAQAALPPQQANAAGAAITPVRRRTTTSVRVERRRNQKHLTLVDAMRKLAKKRETSLQKQQHAAGLAAMRKANEAAQPPPAQRYTPQEFSRLKHERELQMMERVQRHQMQQEAARRVRET
jgi:chromatin modification-related protein VID21